MGKFVTCTHCASRNLIAVGEFRLACRPWDRDDSGVVMICRRCGIIHVATETTFIRAPVAMVADFLESDFSEVITTVQHDIRTSEWSPALTPSQWTAIEAIGGAMALHIVATGCYGPTEAASALLDPDGD